MANERNTRRVKLANILERAGYNVWKIADAIGYPRCTGFVWQTALAGQSYGKKPDDDFRVSGRFAGWGEPVAFPGADLRRNVLGYEYAIFTFNETTIPTHRKGMRSELKRLFVGLTEIFVDTFDGWGSGWLAHPWRITFSYSDGSTVSLNAGRSMTGVTAKAVPSPTPSDYYTTGPHTLEYHPNGSVVVPPAQEWDIPDFWYPPRPLVLND